LNFFWKKKKSLRGINADFVGCEEFAFIPVRVWREVIVPLLGRDKAVLIGISTPVDSFNFFSKLILKVHPKTGQPLFLLAIIELACKRCKDNGRAVTCRHLMKYLPPWKSRDNQDVTDVMLSDQPTTILRETMGVTSNEGNSFIEKKHLDRWFAQERYKPKPSEHAHTVLVVIDPNATDSATASEMAIVTFAMKWNGNFVSSPCMGLWLRTVIACL
jgi:hypothetical protein